MTQPQITYRGMPHSPALEVHVPGREIVATHQQNVDAYAAISQAFDVVIRQLEDDNRRKRGDVKRHAEPRGDPTP